MKQEDFEIIELSNEDKFFALTLAEEIKQIARPLSLLGISYFNQIRIFKDGSRISLGTHADWLKHFHEQKYYLSGQFSRDGHLLNENKGILWTLGRGDNVLKIASDEFNIDNGYTIIKHHTEYNDFFCLLRHVATCN